MSVECRKCGSTFRIDDVWYYDNLCPPCMIEEGEEERTWPGCAECGERIPPDEMATTLVLNRGTGEREAVPVHAGCK